MAMITTDRTQDTSTTTATTTITFNKIMGMGTAMLNPIATAMIMHTATVIITSIAMTITMITTMTTIIITTITTMSQHRRIFRHSRFQKSTVRYPFGVQRIEVLFGLSNAIFLLFIGMNMLKESLEHLMLEGEHHGGDHHGRIPLFWTIIGLGATLVGSIGYQNHEQFCLLLQANNGSGSSTWSSAAGYSQRSLPVTRNQFSLATLACAAGVVLVWLLPAADSLDKLVAIGQSIVMFALGGPLTKVLGMILLQTTPPMALESVEDAVRQLAATDGSILGLERAHVWANTYNQLVGTVVVRIAKEADEAVALKAIQQRLFSVLDVDPHALGAGELTVQVKPTVSEEQAQGILKNLANLQKQLPGLVKSVHLGTNFASRAKGYTHGFTMIFDSKEALETYDKSPEHTKVVVEDVRPNVDDVLAFDYEIAPFSSPSHL
ncbi:Endoplasmic reticulum zinc transporter [Actinomortierella wolfii]|nr:Endoplasmic reticulum zinc transporter [Actinomortierella wolfii]